VDEGNFFGFTGIRVGKSKRREKLNCHSWSLVFSSLKTAQDFLQKAKEKNTVSEVMDVCFLGHWRFFLDNTRDNLDDFPLSVEKAG